MERDLAASLFVRFRLPVFRFLRRLLGDVAVAEDLTQETFLRALDARYRPAGRDRAWVFQIARNLARDRARAIGRRPTVVDLPDVVARGDVSVASELQEALDALSDTDRELFLLREVGGLSYQEISEASGLTPDGVRSRLYRTRLTLRAALSPASRA